MTLTTNELMVIGGLAGIMVGGIALVPLLRHLDRCHERRGKGSRD